MFGGEIVSELEPRRDARTGAHGDHGDHDDHDDQEFSLDGLPRVLEALVEVSRGSFAKRDSEGHVDFYSPVPCPYNYGCIPEIEAPDGAPLDVVLLGPRQPRGARVTVELLGIVDFLDCGQQDPKLITVPLGVDIGTCWPGLDRFFRVYALAKRCLAAARRQRGETRFRGWLRHPAVTSGPRR